MAAPMASPISTPMQRIHMPTALALLATYLVWGSTYLAIRVALESFPPFLMMGMRFIIAGVILFVFLRLRGAPMPTPGQWLHSAAVGVLLLGGGMGLVAFAEQYIASALTAVIVATLPMWTALFAGLWGNWPSKQEWLGLILGFSGVALLSFGGDTHATPIGIALLVTASASWGFGSVWSKRLDLPKGAMANAAEMLTGGLIVMAFALLRGEQITEAPTVSAVLALVYLITFGSLIAMSAYIYLLGRVSPTLATSYAYVNPVIALALGVGLAGEQLPAMIVVSFPLILFGVACIMLRKSKG